MADVRPFRGLRFAANRAGDLAGVLCPPYDVISPEEQRALHERHPFNVVRVEFGFERPGDTAGDNRYTRAAETLRRWRSEGVLQLDPDAAFYLHELRWTWRGEARVRRDLIAAVRLEDWDRGVVLPHERTMRAPKADRLALLRATATNLSPVWLLHRVSDGALARAWELAEGQQPAADVVEPDGQRHRLWLVSDPALCAAIQEQLADARLYVADGHHRYETALAFRDEQLAAAAAPSGEEPWCFVLALLTPADDPGLVVLATHRLLRGLGPVGWSDLERVLGERFDLERQALVGEDEPGSLSAVLDRLAAGHERLVFALLGPEPDTVTIATARDGAVAAALPADRSPAWRALDVARIEHAVIEPVLRMAGAARESALGYTRDPLEAWRAVCRGEWQIAILLNPTPVRQVLAVAEAGDRMPEKSTYFYPKPPTGLVLRPLEVESAPSVGRDARSDAVPAGSSLG